MCTVTWQPLAGAGYEVVFSRDEQRSRALAEGPGYRTAGKLLIVSPRDPQGGGTWIYANEKGYTGCLLNRYDVGEETRPQPDRDTVSRGRLLLSLAALDDQQEIETVIQRSVKSAQYLPFIAWILSPRGEVFTWSWDGVTLKQDRGPSGGMITTSAHASAEVRRSREAAYARRVPLDDLDGFHRAPGIVADAYSVRMSRPDARTVSLTRVRLRGDTVRMDYASREGDAGFAEARTVTLGLALASEALR